MKDQVALAKGHLACPPRPIDEELCVAWFIRLVVDDQIDSGRRCTGGLIFSLVLMTSPGRGVRVQLHNSAAIILFVIRR